MAKHIVFCADGTWNGPGKDLDGDGKLDGDPHTNVYKTFSGLAGEHSDGDADDREQEKQLEVAGRVTQVAKYIHGVGNSRNRMFRALGGAFGAGVITRIVRGYTFVSRHYDEGDHIVLCGFSRGAYTARALGGLIASQGLLRTNLTEDKETAYRLGTQAWRRYRKMSQNDSWWSRLSNSFSELSEYLSKSTLKDDDLRPVATIQAIGVWDTVGALGVPAYVKRDHHKERADSFQFADTDLSKKVAYGFHAVALDELRVDFTPTLWTPSERVQQVAFPGAHSDVGGGYPTENNESGLSDIALGWMKESFQSCGISFREPIYQPFAPQTTGPAHQPWQGKKFPTSERELRNRGVVPHASIAARQSAGPVLPAPNAQPTAYLPMGRV